MVCLAGAASCGDDSSEYRDPAAVAAANAAAQATAPTTSVESGQLDPIDIVGEIINFYDLQDGECFNRVEDIRAGRKVVITSRIPCADPHLFEVFHMFDFNAPHPAIYPGDDVMEDYALQGCYGVFEDFVGEMFELSIFDIGVFTPDRKNFEDDAARYRGIHCWLQHVEGEFLDGTAAGQER